MLYLFLVKNIISNIEQGILNVEGEWKNYGEAQSAESRSDFIHKRKSALKSYVRKGLVTLKNFRIGNSIFDIGY
jgi:hypothetical protein